LRAELGTDHGGALPSREIVGVIGGSRHLVDD
jgi:hypothetical protein